jgi:hypothetical protein
MKRYFISVSPQKTHRLLQDVAFKLGLFEPFLEFGHLLVACLPATGKHSPTLFGFTPPTMEHVRWQA